MNGGWHNRPTNFGRAHSGGHGEIEIKRPTSNAEHRNRRAGISDPGSSGKGRQTTNCERPTSNLQHRMPNAEHPTTLKTAAEGEIKAIGRR